jgi:hypothetical protein
MNIIATPPIRAEINERSHPDSESNKYPIKGVCVKVKIMLDQNPKGKQGYGHQSHTTPLKAQIIESNYK